MQGNYCSLEVVPVFSGVVRNYSKLRRIRNAVAVHGCVQILNKILHRKRIPVEKVTEDHVEENCKDDHDDELMTNEQQKNEPFTCTPCE